MSRKLLYIVLLMIVYIQANDRHPSPPTWAVVGAGPAGIAVVGLLMDSGVPGKYIHWIDTEFNVGRLGKYYENVPGNARVNQYIAFLKACKTFGEVQTPSIDALMQMPGDATPALHVIIDPLKDITNYLRTRVMDVQDQIVSLDFKDTHWNIGFAHKIIASDHVVLATGSHPRPCPITSAGAQIIPLDMALDKNILAKCIAPTDTVMVVGSAHSALLIVRYLTEMAVNKIVNIYKHPIVYPTPTSAGVIWPEAGLKGELAKWTQTVLAHNPPANLVRAEYSEQMMDEWLPKCTKIIYAGGFDRNELPPINGDLNVYAKYDTSNGVIGPRLFGVGIAFPEKIVDAAGHAQYMVGLPFFMPYIQRIMPEWMKKLFNRKLYEFDSLFSIEIL